MRNIKSIVVILVVSYISLTCYYAYNVPASMKFLDQYVKQVSYVDVEDELTKIIDQYEFTVQGKEDFVLTGEDLGIGISKNEKSVIKDIDKNFLWFLNKNENITRDVITIDDEKIYSCLNEHYKYGEESQNASIVYSDGKYEIEKEVLGTYIDVEAMKNEIISKIVTKEKHVVESDYYKKPSIYTEDLVDTAKELNSIISKDYYVLVEDEKIELEKENVVGMIDINEDGSYKFNEEKVQNELETAAKEFEETIEIKDMVTTTKYSAVDKIDDFIVTASSENKSVEVELDKKVTTKTKYQKADTLEETYIEVNLQKQHLWYYEEGELVFETPVVTGNEANGWGTVPGDYEIMSKSEQEVLDGSTVGYDYIVKVNYWLPISEDGTGIHDGTWINQEEFGTDKYKTEGSHGCVTLSFESMEKLYTLVEVGTKVYVTE